MDHFVDRDVPAHIAQEIHIGNRQQPVRIVRHQGVFGVGRFAKCQEPRENLADAVLVGLDISGGQQFPRLIFAGRITHMGGAAPHQGQRPVAGLLQPVQHHDLYQAARMQARRCAVKADIGGNLARHQCRVETIGVRALVNESALIQNVKEIGPIFGHWSLSCGLSSVVG